MKLGIVGCGNIAPRYAKTIAKADGLVVGTSGNISVRAGDLVAVTPTGVDYSSLRSQDVPVVSLDGSIVDGELRPTRKACLRRAG